MGEKYPAPEVQPKSEMEASNAPVRTNDRTNSSTTSSISPSTSPELTPEKPVATNNFVRISDADLQFETSTATFKFNQDLSALTSARLKDFKQESKSPATIELINSPLVMQATTRNAKNATSLVGFHAERIGDTLKFYRDVDNWKLETIFSPGKDGYSFDVTLNYTNNSPVGQELNAGFMFRENITPPEKSGGIIPSAGMKRDTILSETSSGKDMIDIKEYCEEYATEKKPAVSGNSESISYLGFDSHYFLKIFQPSSDKFDFEANRVNDRSGDGCPLLIVASQAQGVVPPGETVTLNYRTYFGPKKLEALAAFDTKLETAIDLGWFEVVARPLLLAVKGVYGYFGNYGIAIILITILLKILFFPLTKAAAVSMKKMQKLQPQMQSLREKYKEDPRKQQQELMKFMKTNKVNPAKGCIPILPQVPVFIAFYNVLSHAIELRHAPFLGWITDLSAADPFYVTPVLLGIGMFAQQKLTPNAGMDKNQQRMMMMMPVIFTVMFFSLPAGLVLYMIVNTIVSIAQQQWLNRRLVI